MQRGLDERNAGLLQDRRIEFRVGVHLGDVVEKANGDLICDGVNIAARLEGICRPGAICLSTTHFCLCQVIACVLLGAGTMRPLR